MRIGIDLGGTKIAAVALDEMGVECARTRADTPHDYPATLAALADTVSGLERMVGRATASVGISLPGVVDARAGTVRAVNLPWLDEQPFAASLSERIGRDVRLANDGNCFALSEAVDGAAAGAEMVFGVILGTGVGGGLVVDGRILGGANALAGEWGHTPLPWRTPADGPPERCGCGRLGCIETLLSGAGLTRLHARRTDKSLSPPEIAHSAQSGDPAAQATLDHYADALARALAMIVNILDPDAMVVGGGLSNLAGVVEVTAVQLGRYALVAHPNTRIVRARYGAESGMRGAAWLWSRNVQTG